MATGGRLGELGELAACGAKLQTKEAADYHAHRAQLLLMFACLRMEGTARQTGIGKCSILAVAWPQPHSLVTPAHVPGHIPEMQHKCTFLKRSPLTRHPAYP
eukprot:1161909-Pelagomonas_calceolata.AAC.15